MSDLTIEILREAVRKTAVALRCVTDYQPAGGPGDKVFPPTYEGGHYATEKRYDPQRGIPIDCVLLDSVQSQANRMELALLEAWDAQQIELPVVVVDFRSSSAKQLERDLRVTSLDAPHRLADAILRDSYDGKYLFRQSERGKLLDTVDARNATPLLEMCPTALIFGMWDSTGPKGGLGAKFQRALVSEIVGYDAVPGRRTSSRIDPLGIQRDESTTIYRADGGLRWTPDPASAVTNGKKKEPAKFGDGKPSEINHGNVTPTIADGGFTIAKALQVTTISLPALRRLHFPAKSDTISQERADTAARTALAALGLCAAALAREAGCDLRSRCNLVATTPFTWELLDQPGDKPKPFSVPGSRAIDLLKSAVADLRKHGFTWSKEPIRLKPSDELLELVIRSQHLAVAGKGEAED
ncbi:MAG: type I-U CRISPR-associated RAMP protein Csb1/Cas7u [Planctomycetota bacterium]